ncbi:SMP-30/gluconolactonase/LRE family protein [Rhodocytophaga aerolata]|uniref:Regucalcin n=1 Tax=Rhodocytophaga aerolata TaxID=455078 RepID=A0ABT8R6K3_9BACT|nr:SMP-30/gluconolactonase/LRE family protein [Rhodocytophaga aerolata]MDO1446979.1 SMP-30/gluconolactonase/LRE family protein [Rhodocytophaga aerolata]
MNHLSNSSSLNQLKVEVVVDAKAILGEGAIWDSRSKLLYWVDIMQGFVHSYNPANGQTHTSDVGQYVGTVVPRHSGELLLAVKNGFSSLNPATGKLTPISNPEAHLPGNRFNDGKCDPAGRFWAGTMSLKQSTGAGSLYCLHTDLRVEKVIEQVTISNGLVWSSDHKTFYYIDTPTLEIAAYDYDLQTGKISNRRVAITVPKEEGSPDGMTIDAENMLWIAHYGGAQVARWNPYTGKKMQSVTLPVSQPTSCAFGGEKLNDLYITTCRENMKEEQLQKEPLAGALFRVSAMPVQGVLAYEFKG